MKYIYVASSWRNQRQWDVVRVLNASGFSAYDFKNPGGMQGFRWDDVDPNWQNWTHERYITGLQHPLATQGFHRDCQAMSIADAFVLVLPCGRSAHLEAGWAVGQGKPVYVLLDDTSEPELMYRLCFKICTSLDEIIRDLKERV